MNFTVSKEHLQNGINIVSRALSSKTPMPILEGILVETTPDGLKLTATNLELGIEHTLPATIAEEGRAVLPGKFFNEVCRRMPDDDIVCSQRDNTVTLQCRNARTNLQVTSPEEFPQLPTLDFHTALELEHEVLKDMIQQTTYAIAQDDSRPILMGVLVEASGRGITMVALDSFRLAMRQDVLLQDVEAVKTIIPGKALTELGRIVNENDVRMHIGNQHVSVDLGDTRVVMRVMEGEFIHYQQILPKEYQTRIRVSRTGLDAAVGRVALMAREGQNHLVRFAIKEEQLAITSNSEIGDALDELPIYLEGKELEISFNSRYLIDALKNVTDDEIIMDFTTALSPCLMRPGEGDGFLALILPVRSIA